MAKLRRVGDLETCEAFEFERRSWVFERIGWAGMAALVALALLGLFGGGPLSRARAGEEGSALWVNYERFARMDTPSRVEVHLGGGAPGERTRLWVSSSLVSAGALERTEPAAESIEVGEDRSVMTFPRASAGGVVVFVLRPLRPCIRSAEIGLVGGPEITVKQFVYP